jgi:hypothetical protein
MTMVQRYDPVASARENYLRVKAAEDRRLAKAEQLRVEEVQRALRRARIKTEKIERARAVLTPFLNVVLGRIDAEMRDARQSGRSGRTASLRNEADHAIAAFEKLAKEIGT